MKRVEYVCDVCEGELLNKGASSWYEMITGRGVFGLNMFGYHRLYICNNCWSCCKEWVNDNKLNKEE